MLARWVFPINLLRAGQHVRATGTWVLLCCALLTGCVLCVLLALGWPAYLLLQQSLWGIALSVLLTDLLFISRSRIPFTQPRLPGRANLPITLVLYAAAFPVFVLLTVVCEIQSESRPTLLLRVLLGIAALHVALRTAGRKEPSSSLNGYSLDEPDDEFQTLGLSHYS